MNIFGKFSWAISRSLERRDQTSLARAGPVLDRRGCQWGGLVVLLKPLGALKLRHVKVKVQCVNLALTSNGAHVSVCHLLDPVSLGSHRRLPIDQAQLGLRVFKGARWPSVSGI
jgi:hypothetical protein